MLIETCMGIYVCMYVHKYIAHIHLYRCMYVYMLYEWLHLGMYIVDMSGCICMHAYMSVYIY